MFTLYESRLGPHFYDPKDGHHVLDVLTGKHEGEHVIETILREQDIASHVKKKAAFLDKQDILPGRLRVLFSAERFDQGIESVPFPFTRPTWSVVSSEFALPVGFLDYLVLHASVATEFKIHETQHGFMATLGSCGIALSFDQSTHTTNCFVVGLCDHQLEHFKKALRKLRHNASDPRLCVAIWLEIYTEVRVLRSGHRRTELENIQLQTGMHFNIDEPLLYKTSLNVDALTHKITVLWHSLAWDEFALKTLLQGYRRLSEVFPDHEKNTLPARNCISMRLTNICDLIQSLQGRTASSIQHANIQLQTIYNFVNQRDSRVNIDHAGASRQLAELSLHDSSVMRSIALDSNKVALLTRRDSTDMRIIAAVTLGFLPPTFIATLFSTGFFNFHPTKDGKVVSSWIWLYALVAFVLTTCVLGGWYLFSKRSARDIRRAFCDRAPDTHGLRALPETTVVALANLPSGLPSAMRAFTAVAAAQPPGMRSPPLGYGSDGGAGTPHRTVEGATSVELNVEAKVNIVCGKCATCASPLD